jgi:hypothetical protein
MQKKANPKRGPVDLQDVRRAIFLLAITATLGFWAYFSKINLAASANESRTSQGAGTASPVQVNEQASLDLPPMPTLVPPLDPATASLSAPPAVSQSPEFSASRPAGLTSGKILLGGAKPSAGNSIVTSTRSSK